MIIITFLGRTIFMSLFLPLHKGLSPDLPGRPLSCYHILTEFLLTLSKISCSLLWQVNIITCLF